jgi:hypothetical protein
VLLLVFIFTENHFSEIQHFWAVLKKEAISAFIVAVE